MATTVTPITNGESVPAGAIDTLYQIQGLTAAKTYKITLSTTRPIYNPIISSANPITEASTLASGDIVNRPLLITTPTGITSLYISMFGDEFTNVTISWKEYTALAPVALPATGLVESGKIYSVTTVAGEARAVTVTSAAPTLVKAVSVDTNNNPLAYLGTIATPGGTMVVIPQSTKMLLYPSGSSGKITVLTAAVTGATYSTLSTDHPLGVSLA